MTEREGRALWNLIGLVSVFIGGWIFWGPGFAFLIFGVYILFVMIS